MGAKVTTLVLLIKTFPTLGNVRSFFCDQLTNFGRLEGEGVHENPLTDH